MNSAFSTSFSSIFLKLRFLLEPFLMKNTADPS